MLKVNSGWLKATCVKNLSSLEGQISSTIYEEKYPLIGRTYKLDAMYVMNELRDPAGRCIPRNPWDITQDIIKVHIFGWTSPEDVFGEPEGFPMQWFIYREEGFWGPYEWFKRKGINIRVPGWQDVIQKRIYDKGIWKPGKIIKETKKSYAMPNTAESNAFAKMQKQAMSPGGEFYDKPYYDLQVKGGRVVEPGKVTKSLILSGDL
jgi:hypothetical protein